LEVIGQ